MDKHVTKTTCRFRDAAVQKDTATQWDLVAASVEEANINSHGLTGKYATNMRGRSKATFNKSVRNLVEGL